MQSLGVRERHLVQDANRELTSAIQVLSNAKKEVSLAAELEAANDTEHGRLQAKYNDLQRRMALLNQRSYCRVVIDGCYQGMIEVLKAISAIFAKYCCCCSSEEIAVVPRNTRISSYSEDPSSPQIITNIEPPMRNPERSPEEYAAAAAQHYRETVATAKEAAGVKTEQQQRQEVLRNLEQAVKNLERYVILMERSPFSWC